MALSAPTELDYVEISTAATLLQGTAAKVPTANRLLLAQVNLHRGAATVADVSELQVSGWGLTWKKVGVTEAADGGTKRTLLFKAYQGTGPVSGRFQITGLPDAHTAIIEIEQWAGTPTGLDAAVPPSKVKVGRNFGETSFALTMDPFGATGNAQAGFFGSKGNATTLTVGSGMTALRNDSIDSFRRLLAEYRLSYQASMGFSVSGFTTQSGLHHWGIGVEIVEAAGGTGYSVLSDVVVEDVDDGGGVDGGEVTAPVLKVHLGDGVWVPVFGQ